MSISIALCTYNGEAYLVEQLQSIAAQTVTPNELVICDDGSTDETIAIIEAFSAKVPFAVRLFRNEKSLGSTANFEKALKICEGDIIFLSDQDDIWLPQKIATILSWFNEHPGKDAVFTNGYIVNDKKEILGTLWAAVRFTAEEKKRWKRGNGFRQLMQYQNRATGATMALRRSFLPYTMPFEKMNFWLHDGIIITKAALLNKGGFIDDKLILYRQHRRQQLGIQIKTESPLLSLLGKIKNKSVINKDVLLQKNYEDSLVMKNWVRDIKAKKIITEKN